MNIIDLGCGTSKLALELAVDVADNGAPGADGTAPRIHVLLLDNNDEINTSTNTSTPTNTTFIKCDLTSVSSPPLIPREMVTYPERTVTVALDKSTLDFLLSTSSAAQYLQNLSTSIRPDVAYFISFHAPALIAPILSSLFAFVAPTSLPRSSSSSSNLPSPPHDVAGSSTAWNSDGTFKPDQTYQTTVWLYKCSSILPPDHSMISKSLSLSLDNYYTVVSPMLTPSAEQRLRISWGEEARAIEGAYDIMFPDEGLKECYGVEDFRGDYKEWVGGRISDNKLTIELEQAIMFLRENQ